MPSHCGHQAHKTSPMQIHVVIYMWNSYVLFYPIVDIMGKVETICITGCTNLCDRMHSCQDQFNSEGELQKPELLNDIQDLASPCVVHPCLNSPRCPEIGQRVGQGRRCSA